MRLRLVATAALALALLAGCTPTTTAVTDPPSASPMDTGLVPPGFTNTPTPDPGPPEVIPADLKANVIDAMNSGNTAAIDGYLADSVRVTYAATYQPTNVTDHVEIVNDLTALTSDSITWDFALAPSVVAGYAATSPFAPDFPTNSIVGKSSNREVVSFTVAGGKITRVFIAVSEASLIL